MFGTKHRFFIGGLLGVFLCLFTLYCISNYRNSQLLLTLFPPEDLYTNIVNERVSLAGEKLDNIFNYRHRYAGTYLYGLRFENRPAVNVPTDTSAEINVVIESGNKKILKKTHLPWSGIFGEGVILGHYNVPKDVPLDEVVQFHFVVDVPDQDFYDQYGTTYFFIDRASGL